MSNTVTFNDKMKWFELTTRTEYLEKLVDENGNKLDPSTVTMEDHTVKYDFKTYLHNPTGPAVRYLDTLPKEVLEKINTIPETLGGVAYWVDGKVLSGDEREKFIHDLNFTNDFKTLLAK